MLSGRRQPLGSLEITYWRAFLRLRDEQSIGELEHGLADKLGGLI